MSPAPTAIACTACGRPPAPDDVYCARCRADRLPHTDQLALAHPDQEEPHDGDRP